MTALRRWFGTAWQHVRHLWQCPPAPRGRRLGRLTPLEERYLPSVTPVGPVLTVVTTTSGQVATSPAGGNQQGPPQAVAVAPNGTFVVVWSANIGGGVTSGWDVFAQRFDAAGNPLGSAFRVNTYTNNDQLNAAVAMDAAGNSIVTWASNGQDGSGWGIYAQRFNAAGVAQGGEFQVNTTSANNQTTPSIAADAAGDFVIAWTSNGQDGNGNGVYAQRFNAAGTAVGGEFLVNTYTSGDQQYPTVAMSSGGSFVIAWESVGQGSEHYGTYAQRYDANGVAQGGELHVNTIDASAQGPPAAAMDGTGDFLIAWAAQPTGGGNGTDIYGRYFDPTGTPTGPQFQVNTAPTGNESVPSVAADASGDFLVTWSVPRSNGKASFYGQAFSPGGAASAAQFTIADLPTNTPADGSVAGAGNGNFVAVWNRAGNGGPDRIDAQIYRTAGVVVAPTSGLATTTAGGSTSFTVALTTQPTADVTLPVASSDPTQGVTSVSSLTFTAANWNVPQTVTVTGVLNPSLVGNTTYYVNLGPATSTDLAYSGMTPPSVPITDVGLFSAGFNVTPTSGLTTSTSGGTASFTVALTSRPLFDVTIPLSSSDPGTGTTNVSSLTFTAANWNTPQTVIVTGVVNPVVVGNTPYTINLGAASSLDLNYSGRTPPSVSVTNLETYSAGVQVTPTAGLSTTKAGGTTAFSVVLTSQPTQDVVIPVASSDTGEGTVSTASLTFTPGNWNVAQTVTITGVNDGNASNVPYTINLGPTGSGDPNYRNLTPPSVAITNVANPAAGVRVTLTGPATTSDAGGSTTFTVVLTSAPTANVTVPIATSDPTAGTPSAPSVTFTPLDWGTPQTVTVTGQTDNIVNGDQHYSITFGPTSSGDGSYNGLTPPQLNLTNLETQTAGVTVAPTSGLTTTTAGGSASFTVVLNNQPTADVTIPVRSSDPSLGTTSVSSLTFTAANWSTPQTVVVTGTLNPAATNNAIYTIDLGPTTSADTYYSGLTPASVSVTNVNSFSTGFTVTPTAGLTTSEDGGTASFTVALTSRPVADVTIRVASSDPSAGTPSVSSLTFTPLNWNAPQTVIITGQADGVVTSDTPYTITLGAASSLDPRYNGLTPPGVSVTNLETETVAAVVALTSSPTTTENGGTATFTVVLNGQPTANVFIPVVSSNVGEATSSVAGLTFTPADWNVPQTVTVTGVPDHRVDGDVGYTIDLGPASSNDGRYQALVVPSVALTNQDVDRAGFAVTPTAGLVTTSSGGTAAFSVALTSQPLAPVTVFLGSNNAAEGQTSTASLTFTPANWDQAQTITVTGQAGVPGSSQAPYDIVFSQAISGDGNYRGQTPASVSATNVHNASPVPAPSPPPVPVPTPLPRPITNPVTTAVVPPIDGAFGTTAITAAPAAAAAPPSVSTATTATVQASRAGAGAAEDTAAARAGTPTVTVADGGSAANLRGTHQWLLASGNTNGVQYGGSSGPLGAGNAAWIGAEDSFTPASRLPGARHGDYRGGDGLGRIEVPWAPLEETVAESFSDELQVGVGAVAVTGLLASAGYVLLNTRAGLLVLSLLTSRPLWNDLDPLEIVCAWDEAEGKQPAPARGETLLSLVDGGPR